MPGQRRGERECGQEVAVQLCYYCFAATTGVLIMPFDLNFCFDFTERYHSQKMGKDERASAWRKK